MCDVDLPIRRCVLIAQHFLPVSIVPNPGQESLKWSASPVEYDCRRNSMRTATTTNLAGEGEVIRRRHIHKKTTRRRAHGRSFTLTGRIHRAEFGSLGCISLVLAGCGPREGTQAPFFNALTSVYTVFTVSSSDNKEFGQYRLPGGYVDELEYCTG